jgi:hypothetical protein
MAVHRLFALLLSDVRWFCTALKKSNKKKLCKKACRRQYWSESGEEASKRLVVADRRCGYAPEWYLMLFIIIGIGAVVSVEHKAIVEYLEPFARKMRAWPGGWVSIRVLTGIRLLRLTLLTHGF